MCARVQVIGLAHPFRFDYKRCEVPVGGSVWDCLEASGCPVTWAASAVVHLNDQRVPREWWSHVRPKAGSTLTYRVMPKGGSLLRTLLTLATIAAAVVAGIYLGPIVGPAIGITSVAGISAVSAGIQAAVGRGGALELKALPPAGDRS